MPTNEFKPLSTGPLDDLRAAKRAFSARLLAPRTERASNAFSVVSPAPADNVLGVGIGEKYADGQPTGVLSVRFLVRRKFPARQLGAHEVLPPAVDGLVTDVEEVGTFRLARATATPAPALALPAPRTRMRPAHPGSSIGCAQPHLAGTFGALVTDGGTQYILGSSHVLAPEPAQGAPILQPGTEDGGSPGSDVVARLSRAAPLRTDVPNEVDAALAALTEPGDATPEVLFIGRPAGVGLASLDMTVHKFGRSTAYTVGRVTSVDTDMTVEYETGNLVFHEQIMIVGAGSRAFATLGDSGSLIMERGSNRAVGLLCATAPTYTLANPLQKVLDALAVALV